MRSRCRTSDRSRASVSVGSGHVRWSYADLFVGELDARLVPRGALVIDVVALTVDPATFVRPVGEVELFGQLSELGDYIVGSTVVLLESTHTTIEVVSGLAVLRLIQVAPFVLHHRNHSVIDGELHAVSSVDVIQADVTVMVILLEDD